MHHTLKQTLLFVTAFGSVLAAGLEIRQSYARVPSAGRSPARGRAISEWQELLVGGVAQGPENAAYTLVLFSDYQCPACRALHRSLTQLLAAHPESLRVVTRQLPLGGIHRFARAAAGAATCAGEQKRFSEYERLLYDSQDSLGLVPWSLLARRAGVTDLAAFESCLVDPRTERQIVADEQLAARLGFTGTPTFVVAGRAYEGAWPDSSVMRLLRSSVPSR